jgi:hypothetical protein
LNQSLKWLVESLFEEVGTNLISFELGDLALLKLLVADEANLLQILKLQKIIQVLVLVTQLLKVL